MVAGGCGLAAWGAAGQAPPVPIPRVDEAPRTLFSTTRRFMVSGFGPAAAADLARWAEEVARRLEGYLGPIPLERGWYLEIKAVPGDRVLRAQGWVDGLLQQRLDLGRSEELDQEDALEGLVWLLLNRWPIVRQSIPDRVEHLARVPDWLSVGVAQNLYAELRARNAGVVQERWHTDQLVPWTSLVEQEVLPSGRWAEKAETAFFVNWMVEQRVDFDALWQSCAEARRLSAEDISRVVFRQLEMAAVTQEWEVWLAAQQDRKRTVSGLDLAQVEEFDRLARLEEPELQAVRAEVAGPLMLADLVALRHARWVPALATRRSWQLQLAMMGRSPEWQDVARRYIRFLEGLAGRGQGYSGGLFGRGASARQLLALLEDADQARDRLRADIRARVAYLDQVEQASAPPALSGAARQYLDDVERRMGEKSP